MWMVTLAAVCNLIADYLSKTIDMGTLIKDVALIGSGLVVRSSVSPVTKVLVRK